MTLADLIRQNATAGDLAAHLDGLDPATRRAEALSLDRATQRSLFERASTEIDLAHFVPAEREALVPVHHAGRNTLPLPPPHKSFEKRLCRPQDGSARLFGFNESPSRGLIGPGYFVAHPTAGNPEWEKRGAVVVDYFQVPDGPVPAGWPKVVPNSKGLQFFVYRNTRDFMRRVSNHVSIGAAYRHEKALDHYFVLVRDD